MAIYPSTFSTQDSLQPGARGNSFVQTLPGYRNPEERINRTNNHLNVSAHDVPNCKYELDPRLPVLFRYAWAYGFNQVVIPKGRIVALDPTMSLVDFETKKQHNVLTLANGGVPTKLRDSASKYKTLDDANDSTAIVSTNGSGKAMAHSGKEWTPLVENAYTDKYFKPFAETASAVQQLADAGCVVDGLTGKVMKDGEEVAIRPGNIPIGVIGRNEMTRDIDAMNQMMPGPILTDALIEMPWILYKDKAEESFWGSAYGNLQPGDLLKSDENGRFVKSPLSDAALVAAMNLGEYEAERRQVVGEILSTNRDLVPEGAARWATWSLDERLNFDEFNPATRAQTNRRGEDAVANTPYQSTGEYPGYPFDKAFNESNLHMLGSTLRNGNYDMRLEQEYQYSDLGIPGLTDGYNAVVRPMPEEKVGEIHKRGSEQESYIDQIFKASEVNLEKGSLQVKVGNNSWVNAVEGQQLDAAGAFTLTYVNELQGLIKIHMDDTKADAALDAATGKMVEVKMKFNKRGLAGVPTFMDINGTVGSVRILLTK